MAPPVSTDVRPSTAYIAHTELTGSTGAARASAALHTILKDRGHRATEELRSALGVSRQTIHNWRSRGVDLTPAQVWRIAEVYACHDFPTSPEDVEQQRPSIAADTAQLFDAFYDDNHRAALGWLLDFRSTHFPWNEALTVN